MPCIYPQVTPESDAARIPGDYDRANLFVAVVAENLSLELVYPELETVRLSAKIKSGVGL